MHKLFYNENGNSYYVLFGGKGQRSFLCKITDNDCAEYVICGMLEENSWFHGSYYQDFDEAYKAWKEKNDE